MGITLSDRKKCSGCKALQHNSGVYTCLLDVPLHTITVEGKQASPKPTRKCYRPKTEHELTDAITKTLKQNA